MNDNARAQMVIDRNGEPHLVVNDQTQGGFQFNYVARVNGAWQTNVVAQRSRWNAQWLMRPHIAMDPDTDQVWISGWIIGGSNTLRFLGQPHNSAVVWRYTNASSNPVMANSNGVPYMTNFPLHWGGIVNYDPRFPGDVIVAGNNGLWRRMASNGSVVQSGQVFAGNSSEKMNFAISSVGGNVVYHSVSHGFSREPSGYQNTIRATQFPLPEPFGSFTPYSDMQEHYFHPGIGVDRTNAAVAYMGFISDGAGLRARNIMDRSPKGLYVNIWNGTNMVFPPNALLRIDDVVSSHYVGGVSRTPTPSFAPAAEGGTWVGYVTPQGVVRLVFLNQNGVLENPFPNQADPRMLASGARWVALATDADNGLHVAWGNGVNIFYSRFSSSEMTEPVTLPGWGDMDKVVGQNIYFSEWFGELEFGDNGNNQNEAFSRSLGSTLFRVNGTQFFSFDFGEITKAQFPGYLNTARFGEIHFGARKSTYNGAVFTERFGWIVKRNSGNGSRNVFWVGTLGADLEVNEDGSFTNRSFGLMRPLGEDFDRYDTDIGPIQINRARSSDTGVWAFSENLRVDLVFTNGLVVSPELGFIFNTDIEGWIETTQFGLTFVGAPEGSTNGFLFTERFGWIQFAQNGSGRFFWVPALEMWFASLSTGGFYGFDLGFIDPVPGSFTQYGSRLGRLFIDEFNPPGWVRSARFGFIWAFRGTNAVWFWSGAREEVLGLPESGGIWSTRENRFLD